MSGNRCHCGTVVDENLAKRIAGVANVRAILSGLQCSCEKSVTKQDVEAVE